MTTAPAYSACSSLADLIHPEDLELHVMPIVRLSLSGTESDWQLHGVETLARGPVDSPLRRPDVLFAHARAMGLERILDLTCLERSLRLLPSVRPAQRLFVNVLVETLLDDAFPAVIVSAISRCCRQKLVIEVLEGAVPSFALLRERLAWLHALGIETAIDDVGAPGSDLERLARMAHVHYVKVDQLVMRQMYPVRPREALRWLTEVGSLATHLNAQLLVEGIEAESAHALFDLRALGVHFGQGYLFGTPTAAQGFPWWHAHSHRCGQGREAA